MTATVTPYRCWSPSTASSTISTEAVAPSRSLFLSTHAPLRIRRSRLRDGSREAARSLDQDTTTLDEHAVLRDFLTRKSDTGALLLPVVGDSGSGKSHLVRWVREHIEETARRKVIYLRKDETSLRAVVGRLLAGLDTPRAEELRSGIDRLTASVDVNTLALRLLHGLDEELSATTAEGVAGAKRVLRGQRGLAVVLQDPHVRQYMLERDRFIPQLAKRLMANRQAGDGDRPERFGETDLPLNFADAVNAATLTKKMLTFLDNDAELRQGAVDLLNTHLDSAVRKAYNMGTGSLFQAMLEVRAEYVARGQEIILLIEDFALIQGIQGDLLEAVIETAHRDGRQVGANIRTLMAVTTGYFQDLPETVLTRVHASFGHVYDLDAPFTMEDKGEEYIASFAARYLNATRIGADELATADLGQIPNACDNCPVQVDCHAAFGASAEGYGLYPFNRPALLRMAHSVARYKDQYQFVPRAMLGGVLKQIMVNHHDAIVNYEFPDAAFESDFPLAEGDKAPHTSLLTMIDEQFPDRTEAQRQQLFVRFWDDATTSYPGDQAMRRVFRLPELRGGGEPVMAPTPSRPTARPKPAQREAPPEKAGGALQRKLDDIENWAARNDEMGQDAAREVRQVLVNAIARRYTWLDPLMAQRGQTEIAQFWRNTSSAVFIDGARASGADTNRESAYAVIARSAANSQFLQAVLLAGHGRPMPAYGYYRLAELAENKAWAFTNSLQTGLRVGDTDLVVGLRAALIGATLAGRAWPGMPEDALLDAALDDGRDWTRNDTAWLNPHWVDTLQRHRAERPALIKVIRDTVGVNKGDRGAVLMVDAARLLPLLTDAAKVWEWAAADPPWWVTPAVLGFAGLTSAVDAQFARIRDTVVTARSRLGAGVRIRQVVGTMHDVLSRAAELGVPVSQAEKADLLQKAARVAEASTSVISDLEADIARAAAAPASDAYAAKLRVTARDRGTMLWDINDFLAASDQWLTMANEAARERLGVANPDLKIDVRAVVQEWADLLTPGVTAGE